MKLSTLIVGIAVAILSATPSFGQTVKVGTFDKASVVVAFYRSPTWADVLKQKHAELEEAKKANDQKKVEELERWGSAQQEMAHKQLAGEASLGNILDALQPAFAETAAKARVAMIVPDLPYADKTVQAVDVTDSLLDWLKASEQTRKIIDGMRTSRKAGPNTVKP